MSKLDQELKVRVSAETKSRLEALAGSMGEDTNVSDMVRLAIREYLQRSGSFVREDSPPYTAPKKRKPHAG